MKFEYIKENEIPIIKKGCGRENPTTNAVRAFLETDEEAIRFEYESKAEMNNAYNCIYAYYVRRYNGKSPITVKRTGMTMYVLRVRE